MVPHVWQVLGCSGELAGVIVVNFSDLLANSARRRRIAAKSSAMRVMMVFPS
jgi:hypothetical protein